MKIENEINNVGAGPVSAPKGITLIALVITIIVLLILAGITISLTIGEHGILNMAKQAGVKTEKEAAREKLELALLDLQAKKYTDPTYNDTTYVEDYLTTKDITLEGEIATVGKWKFEVDLKTLAIKKEAGETSIKLTKEVKRYLGKNVNEKYEVKVLVTIESNTEIAKVVFPNEDGTFLEVKPEENKNKLEKDIAIELDKEYVVTINTVDGKEETRKIRESSTEDIRLAEQLVAFRDKVNTGLTYEGKTINLVNNLKLSNVCGEGNTWDPIGNYEEEGEGETHIFKGAFNGNYHVIDYLYIKTDKDYQGLFGYVDGGTISNLVIGEHSTITGGENVGGIVGGTINSTISNCGNSANINGKGVIGGIVGTAYGTNIIGTYNKGELNGNEYWCTGGIVGDSEDNTTIRYSYNAGKVTGTCFVGGISGEGSDHTEIYNCYNIRNIYTTSSQSGNALLGGISGRLRAYGVIEYCYNLGTISVKSSENQAGGITALSNSYSGSTCEEKRASVIRHCYNSGNVNSTGAQIGGICGYNQLYCKVQNSYVPSGITVKDTITKVGSTDGLIGSNNGILSGNEVLATMPSVYEVVNANEETGLNSGNSEYWSNTEYSDTKLQTPKLKWESEIK